MTHANDTESKYVYWTSSDKAAAVLNDLEKNGRDIFLVRKAVCIPLSPQHDVCLVPPEAWSTYDFCRRQFSWYHASPMAGQSLVVSRTPLPDMAPVPDAVITPCPDFSPPALPGPNEILYMVQSPGYRKLSPAAWEAIHEEEPEKHERWLRIMGQENVRFEDLFVRHCANHANFIDPHYTVKTRTGASPYAIGDTKTVCSSCLEFYNIIGGQHATKYVVPCPGAVLFAGLKRNCYYRVMNQNASA